LWRLDQKKPEKSQSQSWDKTGKRARSASGPVLRPGQVITEDDTDAVQKALEDEENDKTSFSSTFSRLRQKSRIRPICPLPRNHVMYIKHGPSITVEDLEDDTVASSFYESPYLKQKVMEKRLTKKGDRSLATQDTPFWRIKKKKKKKIVKWGEEEGVDKTTKELRPEQAKKYDRWEKHIAPEKCVTEMDNALPMHTMDAGKKLIQSLRERALEFKATGVNPDYLESMEKALEYYPGMEKVERRRVMTENKETFVTLIEKGMASVENFNLLIRAYGLQKDVQGALQVHDQMIAHGYETNVDTFVGLIMAADADAPLARKLYLKMRESFISPNAKLMSALMKAHTKAGDLTSAFALLRKMEDEGVQADVVTYTILIDALVMADKLPKAWETFHSIRTWKNIKPDEVLFTVMIKACALNEEAERAINMYDDMRTEKRYPTDITYAELIHAMSTRADFALKAFDFKRHMEAEGMPLSPIVYDHLLRACASLGDIPRARKVVVEMQKNQMPVTPEMYNHLIRTFSSAMRLPKATDFERVAHLQYAWHVLGDARAQKNVPITTGLLNELLKVYISGGYARFAVDLLKQYAVFGCSPDVHTYGYLLDMFHELRDFGRYFAIWDLMLEKYTPVPEMYHTALSMAIMSQSANKTCTILERMIDAHVFPTPELASRLAKVGRQVLEIHRLIGKFIDLHKDHTTESAKRTQALLQAHVDERNLLLAVEGKRQLSPTPEQEVRKKYFQKLKDQGAFRRKWLPRYEYQQHKKKGGDLYSYKHDKPKPLAPLSPGYGS